MIKKLIILCPLLLISLGVAPFAHAEGILFFSPSRVTLTDQDKVEVINVTNQSEMARAYKIMTEDLIMTEEGVTAPVDTFDFSAKRMVRFVPREFTLQPGEKQAVRIMSRISGDTEDGDYHTHLRFLEDVTQRDELNPPPPGQAAITAPLSYEAMIPLIISHGNVETTIGMKDIQLSKDPATGQPKVSLILTRQGNGQGEAYIDTDYIAPDGTVSKATVRRTTYIYREINQRKRDYTLSTDAPSGAGSLRLTLYNSPSEDAQPIDQVVIPLSY